MRPADAAVVADLSTQLGYPVTAAIVRDRIVALGGRADQALLVATDDADRPIGWIHVGRVAGLVAPEGATIHGLVVEKAQRSRGIGASLVAAGETWARARGAATMTVRSRASRERAHRFYERLGYVERKRSVVFERDLG